MTVIDISYQSLSSGEFVQEAADSPNITPTSKSLLRAAISQRLSGHKRLSAEAVAQIAKNVDCADQQNIFRSDVPMYYRLSMQVRQCRCDLPQNAEYFLEREAVGIELDHTSEADPLLHQVSVRQWDCDRYDMRVLQFREQLRFFFGAVFVDESRSSCVPDQADC